MGSSRSNDYELVRLEENFDEAARKKNQVRFDELSLQVLICVVICSQFPRAFSPRSDQTVSRSPEPLEQGRRVLLDYLTWRGSCVLRYYKQSVICTFMRKSSLSGGHHRVSRSYLELSLLVTV